MPLEIDDKIKRQKEVWKIGSDGWNVTRDFEQLLSQLKDNG